MIFSAAVWDRGLIFVKIRLIDAQCASILWIICPSVCPSVYKWQKWKNRKIRFSRRIFKKEDWYFLWRFIWWMMSIYFINILSVGLTVLLKKRLKCKKWKYPISIFASLYNIHISRFPLTHHIIKPKYST